jgi:hypothetical protein
MGEKIENIYDKQKVGEYYRKVGEIEEKEKKKAALLRDAGKTAEERRSDLA